jgi:hypothetical protein
LAGIVGKQKDFFTFGEVDNLHQLVCQAKTKGWSANEENKSLESIYKN